jgi:hypothetical protein
VAPEILAVLNVVPGGADFRSGGHLMDAAKAALTTTATMSAMTAGCFGESLIPDNARGVGGFHMADLSLSLSGFTGPCAMRRTQADPARLSAVRGS